MPSRTLFIGPACALGLIATTAASGQNLDQYDHYWAPLNDLVVYDADGDENTTDDQVRVNGNIAIYLDLVDVCSSIFEPECGSEFELGTSISSASGLLIEADVDAEFLNERIVLPAPPIALPPISFTLGAVDLTILPLATFGLELNGEARSGGAFDLVIQQPPTGFGLTYDGSQWMLESMTPTDPFFDLAEPSIDGDSGVTLSAAPFVALEFTVLVNDAPGWPSPMALFAPGVEFDIQPLANPWWTAGARMVIEGALGWSLRNPELIPWEPIADIWLGRIADAGGPFKGLGIGDNARWTKAIETDPGRTEAATCVAPSVTTPDGNVLACTIGVAGQLIELDSAGDAVAALGVGGVEFTGIRSTDRNTYFLSGWQGWAAELDLGGNVSWANVYRETGGSRVPSFGAMDRWDNGEAIMVGFYTPESQRYNYAQKVDADGNLLWSRIYAPTGLGISFNDVRATDDGGAIMVGLVRDSALHDLEGAYIVKIDAIGEIEWSKVMTTSSSATSAHVVEVAPDGTCYVAGAIGRNINTPEPYNVWISRLTGEGEPLWTVVEAEEITPGGNTWDSVYDHPTGIVADAGGCVLSGFVGLGAGRNAWLWRIDDLGRPVWFKSFHSDDFEQLNDLISTPDGGILAVGVNSSYPVGGLAGQHIWTVKTGADGMVQIDPAYGAGEVVNPDVLIEGVAVEWHNGVDPSASIDIEARPNSLQLSFPAVTIEDLTRR